MKTERFNGKVKMTQRDYSRFLREDGALNVRLIPRPVYSKLVNEYRRQEHVYRSIFEQQFWLWDLEERERKAAEEGREVCSADIAQEVLDEMEDNDWWKCMTAFEQHLVDHFHESPERWGEFLDSVYDEQEEAGWIKRQ
jgi:hypothetical protein